MSQHHFNHTIAFALWNAEEHGMAGSYAYADAAKNSLQIPLYLNFDSSCYDPTGNSTLVSTAYALKNGQLGTTVLANVAEVRGDTTHNAERA